LKEQYGFSNLQPYSPRLKKFNCNKNFVIVEVSSVGKLYSKDKEIKGFQLAGPDKIFYPANAVLLKNGTIKLRAKQVEKPVAIRYNFTNDQLPDLFDINDLPLLPFRTDNN
jgi:sialate O-acetylesterase